MSISQLKKKQEVFNNGKVRLSNVLSRGLEKGFNLNEMKESNSVNISVLWCFSES